MQSLTQLSEDETIFRDTVRKFARKEISPLVRQMDEHAKLDPSLLKMLFEQGLMGIEIP